MKRVFDKYGPLAKKSGAALITGMGFDYVPGDMIASLTARDMGPLSELSLNYAVQGFGPSRGTPVRRSARLPAPTSSGSRASTRLVIPRSRAASSTSEARSGFSG